MIRDNRMPVTVRALAQRINRALEKDGKQLRGTPGRPGKGGPTYYLLDTKRNRVVTPDVNLETLGRELGVLEPHERLDG